MNFLRRFFSAPPNSSPVRRILPFAVGGGFILVALLLAIPPAWEYSNSTQFCGITCHTMPPEYSTYLVSPHARVLCVDCHIGRDLIAVQAFRKVGHLRLVAATLFESYEYPIRTSEMRPARETCELCHFPEKFANDSLRTLNRFETNRQNDPYSVYLLMHTGGGTQRKGLGKGIHWHIENKISYIALDKFEQEIPWVQVQTADGKTEQYNAINSPIDTQNLGKYQIKQMDCITCHNRIAHLIDVPDKAVDSALAAGQIPQTIPFIRSRAVELLSAKYTTTDEAMRAFDALDPYYRDNYADFYATGKADVVKTIDVLKELYTASNYPEQKLDYKTHPNNIGHKDSPGCFRCHDGQHIGSEGKVVRLECNLCHSIPQVVRPGKIEPMLPLTTGIEPTSHLDSAWIAKHHSVFDASCSNCHNTKNPGGTDDSSFCSNSQCHGTNWRYAGFNAPGLAAVLRIYQVEPKPLLEDFKGKPTYAVLQPLFQQQCAGCHGPVPSKGLRLTDYASLMTGSSSGPIVTPGDVDKSKIVEVLTKGHFAKLTPHQMELLQQWIASGAPEK
ncbi:MAG: NapC/NirT family cytochrome c [Anaerolineae bacterium]|nr:NapC/NirT family cytochrome c [Anaerolineae bacterium]